MSDKPQTCKWCGCGYTLNRFHIKGYCSPMCYFQAQQAHKQEEENAKIKEENG